LVRAVARWDVNGSSVDVLQMRKALGRFASGITIVTTGPAEGDDCEIHGMTANAFTSVSLRPPLVLVAIATHAKMHKRIVETGRYGVSILAQDQEALSRHFAGAANIPASVNFIWRDGLPLLEGALVHLSCSVHDSHPAGDHTLHVGKVDGVWYRNGDPLLYYTGSFRALELIGQEGLWGF